YWGPHVGTRLAALRKMTPHLGCRCAATLVAGLLIVRFAAKISLDLRHAVRGAVQQFSRELGGGPFRVPKMWSCCGLNKGRMNLTPREKDKLMIALAALVARARLARVGELGDTESIALLKDFIMEGARDGKSVAELMSEAAKIVTREQVMEGIPEIIHEIEIEATFPDGTKLVTVHDPIR